MSEQKTNGEQTPAEVRHAFDQPSITLINLVRLFVLHNMTKVVPEGVSDQCKVLGYVVDNRSKTGKTGRNHSFVMKDDQLDVALSEAEIEEKLHKAEKNYYMKGPALTMPARLICSPRSVRS